MDGDEIIIGFSIFITICVIVWAVLAIRAYDRIGRE